MADQSHFAQSVAEAAIAEARSVHETVKSRMAEIAERAESSTSQVVGMLSHKVDQVAAQTTAQMSHVAAVTQQLEKNIEAATTSAVATAKDTTQLEAEKIHRNIQAQIEQIRADAQRGDEEVKRQVGEIAIDLATLTDQLNQFKPASTVDVTGSEKKISDAVDSQLKLQSLRIDAVDESVQKAQKTATETSETLHDMLVGIENLGESVKQLRAEIRG